MRKRQKMVVTAFSLAGMLILVQSAGLEIRYLLIGLLCAVSWLLSAWSLREGLKGAEWLMVTLPAVMFTAGVGLFYFLLPQQWWAQVVVAGIFGVGQYALLLSANIFSVAAIRTIALFRAASAVGFVMALITGFFLYNAILSFKFGFIFIGILVSVVSFLILMPAIWTVELKEDISRRVLNFSSGIALSLGFLAMATCFWPISTAVASLFLATMLYVMMGLSQHHFSERLFNRTAIEYLIVGLAVTLTMLFTAI
jgi:hypothetical protein